VNRDRLFILRDLLILLVVVGAGVMLWQPALGRRALAALPPSVGRGTEAVAGWFSHLPWVRGGRRKAQEAPPSAAEPPPAQAKPEETEEPVAPEQPGPPVDDATPDVPIPADEPVTPGGNLPPHLPELRQPPALPAGLRALRSAAEARPSASSLRKLADAAASAGFSSVAADAYEKEAAVYRKQGDPNAAAVESLKAGRHRAEAELYLHAPVQSDPDGAAATLARLEPPYGALLGAFIDRDDQLPTTFQDENWQTHRDPDEFAERVGKKHASLFCYLSYGKPFPLRWAERLKAAGVIPHLAWEPRSLAEVADDDFLDRFADAVARLDHPVFLRFAGEMNGDWTPYHGDPALYREKFRLVSRTIRARAPKAAMIWCVNNVPDAKIDAYYPGDDAVDWVGVNFYNVLYFDNDRSRPADRVHPTDLLSGVYSRYAARKPIAICEYAASHQAAIDPKPRPELAAARLAQLYAALPRRFPRVKLVDWFDCDNLKHARAGRQLNNYSLTDDETVRSAYRRAIAPDYFLSSLEQQPAEKIRPLRSEEAVSGILTVSAWVRAPLDRPRVYLLAGGRVLYAGDEPGPALARWDTRKEPPGKQTLRLLVLDPDSRPILDRTQQVIVSGRPD
jgi:hypothetical protein